MKTIALALALLVSVPGFALAVPDDPESAFVLDLTPAGAHSFHVHCEHNAALSNCKEPSLWENTNGIRALQTRGVPTSSGFVAADSLLLG